MRVGQEPACRHGHDGELHLRHQPFCPGQFLAGHLLEVDAAQQFAVGVGHRCLELDLFLLRGGLATAIATLCQQGLGQPTAQLLALFGFFGARRKARQQHGHHAFEKLRIAPEDMERLVEDRPLILAVDEDGMERPIKIIAFADAHGLHCAQGFNDAARPDGQPRRAQRAREKHQIFDQPAATRRFRWRVGGACRHGRRSVEAISDFTWSSRMAASLPRILAMSS